ncbi:hypothetical protein [Variovorax sp. LT1R16]|uniref:hypothetical protein n=1 Tax=Variovorax sp. LT1R16 TaxID=3443728 RepID=UPI003F46566D
MGYRYFLSAKLGDETVEREVTLEAYCAAERAAGFRPKLWSGDPAYKTTPATGGFGGNGIGGSMRFEPDPAPSAAKKEGQP